MLDAVAKQYCGGTDLHYAIRPGRPLDVIVDVAGEHPPDAIVLAASRRGRVTRALAGSTTDKIIRRASCLVVIVPAGAVAT